jgi:hypothetical protein
MTEHDLFTTELPDIAEADAIGAATHKRIIQSFNTHPISKPDGSYQALAIKWKLADGSTETMLIGQYAALVLRMMFSQLEQNKWTELVTLPPDATPH